MPVGPTGVDEGNIYPDVQEGDPTVIGGDHLGTL